jgi:hypothetical protein
MKASGLSDSILEYGKRKGEHQWQNTFAATARSGRNMITIRHRFWDGYGDGMQDGARVGENISPLCRSGNGSNWLKNMI